MGPGKDDLKEIRILNRKVTWTEEGVEHEGDQRHVEIACKEYGLKPGSKAESGAVAREQRETQ